MTDAAYRGAHVQLEVFTLPAGESRTFSHRRRPGSRARAPRGLTSRSTARPCSAHVGVRASARRRRISRPAPDRRSTRRTTPSSRSSRTVGYDLARRRGRPAVVRPGGRRRAGAGQAGLAARRARRDRRHGSRATPARRRDVQRARPVVVVPAAQARRRRRRTRARRGVLLPLRPSRRVRVPRSVRGRRRSAKPCSSGTERSSASPRISPGVRGARAIASITCGRSSATSGNSRCTRTRCTAG